MYLMTKPMKIFTLSIFAFIIGVSALAQQASSEGDFMNKVFKPVQESEAVYYRNITATAEGYGGTVCWMNGTVRMTGFFTSSSNEELVKHGNFVFYYDNGNVESSGYYEHGIKVGSWKRFTSDGTARTDRYYKPESADFIRDVMAGK
jgi:hypothetical protein